MPSLRELQEGIVRSIREDDNRIAACVSAGGLNGERRLQIYRNNMYSNLTDALAAVFPVTRQLVGETFFEFAAHHYIQAHPSTSGNLHDFGHAFADFAAAFEPARGLAYLPDVARLEWAYHRVFHAADHPPLRLDALATVAPDRHADLRFTLNPACRLVASAYPILRIWQVNQDGHAGDQTVDLGQGGDALLVIRRALEIEFQTLAAVEHAWLADLAGGATLGAATDEALSRDPGFALTTALERHLLQGTLVDFTCPTQPLRRPEGAPAAKPRIGGPA